MIYETQRIGCGVSGSQGQRETDGDSGVDVRVEIGVVSIRKEQCYDG